MKEIVLISKTASCINNCRNIYAHKYKMLICLLDTLVAASSIFTAWKTTLLIECPHGFLSLAFSWFPNLWVLIASMSAILKSRKIITMKAMWWLVYFSPLIFSTQARNFHMYICHIIWKISKCSKCFYSCILFEFIILLMN